MEVMPRLFQPTGICFDYGTLFTVDTSTGTLRVTSSVPMLVDYLKYLHLFGETFELHTKKSTSVTVEIPQAIERLEQVYSFNKKGVDAIMSLIGTTAVTQGPQGTVSSVVMEDERRILKSLRNIKDLLDRFNPQVFTTTHYKDLPKLCPPKAHKLSQKQVSEMRNWRAMYGQSVPQKTVRNMTTKDNPGTLPINLYATDSPTDFTVLRFHSTE